MTFVDPFLLTVTLVMAILLVVGNIYFIAKFAHPADSAFGSSTFCKAIIVRNNYFKQSSQNNQVVAFICAECQVLILPLDVSNFRNGTNVDMKIFWYIIYMTSAFFVTIILPFALFFYESDEDKTFVRIHNSSSSFSETATMDCLKIRITSYSDNLNNTIRILCRSQICSASFSGEYLPIHCH